tara:strand:+ start:18359 stop:18550 length:192 start_codon:yes stop_codon:yes gene_type:complete
MNYPTLDEVANADRLQICRWHRFLKVAASKEEGLIMKRIHLKYREFGGITPAISKQIGWTPPY